MLDPAQVVKDLHKSLRRKVQEGFDGNQVWNELLQDKHALHSYAHAMKTLAENHWIAGSASCRVTWCHKICHKYFMEGGMLSIIRKKQKAKMFQTLKENGEEENEENKSKINAHISAMSLESFWEAPVGDDNKLLLLDVGSCFNPFKDFNEYSVVAVDISPAADDVTYCDFLNLNFDNDSETTSQCKDFFFLKQCKDSLSKGVAPHCTFDIVVFSLLLSYFPVPSQRVQCCINAMKSLKLYGLLLIITPDSSHQNRHFDMMRCWNKCLQCIGFTKYKYEKLEHLHCVAFVKTQLGRNEDLNLEELSKLMYIPQDKQDHLILSKSNVNEEESEEMGIVHDVKEFSNMDLF